LSKEVDRKLQHVPIAEFQYRHEAELAAGFLSDAGIPFRLQSDDAGGADLGLSMLRPSVLWVRALDVEAARELVALEELGSEPPVRPSAPVRGKPTASTGRLSALERAVAGGLAVALLAVAPSLPPSPLRTPLTVLCYVGGFALLGAAAVGRARGLLGGLIRMIAGSPPR
jgi:hypothetical protein